MQVVYREKYPSTEEDWDEWRCALSPQMRLAISMQLHVIYRARGGSCEPEYDKWNLEMGFEIFSHPGIFLPSYTEYKLLTGFKPGMDLIEVDVSKVS